MRIFTNVEISFAPLTPALSQRERERARAAADHRARGRRAVVGARRTAHPVLRLGGVSGRGRVSGQRGAKSGCRADRPRSSQSARTGGTRHAGWHRRSPARHRQTWSRDPAGCLDAAPRQNSTGGCARLCTGGRRHGGGDVRDRPARLGPTCRDPGGVAAGRVGSASGVLARATGRSRRTVVRDAGGVGVPPGAERAESARRGRAVGSGIHVQQPVVVSTRGVFDGRAGLVARRLECDSARFSGGNWICGAACVD